MNKLFRKKEFWLLLPFLEPLLFKDYAIWVDYIFSIGKIFSICLLLKDYINNFKLSSFIGIISLYQFSLFLSTLMNPNGDIVRYIGPTISVIGVCLYMEMGLKRGKAVLILQIITSCYTFFCIVNLFTVLFFPEGLVPVDNTSYRFFLGLENRFSFIFLPLVAISSIYSKIKYNKIKFFVYALSIINTAVLIWRWSVGGMLALILMNTVSIFRKNLFSYRFFHSVNCFIIITLCNILIVFLRLQDNYEYFITNELNKDITLTGRTLLWDYGMKSFTQNPFFGVGYQRIDTLPDDMLLVAHMHNLFMNVLYYGGIIGLFLFILIQSFWIIPLFKHRKSFEASQLTLCLFIALLMSIGDTFDSAQYWILISFAYYIGYINKEENRICKNGTKIHARK